jgi:hypothetical protein
MRSWHQKNTGLSLWWGNKLAVTTVGTSKMDGSWTEVV